MKKSFLAVLLLCFSLCSCGTLVDTNTAKSVELSEKYDFYKESVNNIRTGCNVTPEEADEIFLILVNNCGITDLINYVFKNNDGTFAIWSSGTKYNVTLEDNIVSTVFTTHWFSDVQLYPEIEDNTKYVEAESSGAPEKTETPADNATEEPPHEEIADVGNKNIPETETFPESKDTPKSNTTSPTTSNTETDDTALVDPPASDTPTPTENKNNFDTYNNTDQQNTTMQYVLNTSTLKIHYPSCRSVPKIAPKNYATSDLSLNELLSQGYTTCGNCFK